MTITYSLKIAIAGLKTNKSRSALTILGIVIGITAIMMVMSLGKGAQDLILGQIQSMGPKLIGVVPGKQPKGMMDALATFTDSLKNKDLEALKKKSNVPHAERIMPVVFGSELAIFENESYRPTVFGVSEMFAEVYDAYPAQGQNMTEDDVISYADVVIIGSKIKEELFGNEEALNKKIKIKGRNFRVIGILPQKGSASMVNFDTVAVVPYTTAQQYIFGIKYFNRIAVEADSEANIAATVGDIKITLRNSHNIDNPEDDDFFIETQADALKTVGTITSVLTLFLTAVAGISLVVGGVGIMNIMLVSVTERTREIGLRKSLGATRRDILTQFLMEAVTLTATGGIIGIALGGLFSFLISFVLTKVLGLNWQFVFPFFAAVLGVGVAAVIGLVFGIYPARQAARKSPMEALRYE